MGKGEGVAECKSCKIWLNEEIVVWYIWPSVDLLHKHSHINHLYVDCRGKVREVAVRKLQNRGSTILHAAIVFAKKWQNLRYENISVWYFWPSVNLLHKNHLDVDCWGKVRGVAVRKLQNRGSTILHVAIVFAGQKWLVRHSSCECAIFDRTKPLSSQAKHYIPRRAAWGYCGGVLGARRWHQDQLAVYRGCWYIVG